VSDIAQLCYAGNEWNEGYSLLEYGPLLIGHLLLTLESLAVSVFMAVEESWHWG
jgi:hypothetical protein